MRCPYCNSEVPFGSKFCTECGATLNPAAVQQQTGKLATNTGLMLGAAARQVRLQTVVTEDQIISERAYNGVLMGVLLWGLLVNVALCSFAEDLYYDVFQYVNPLIIIIGYVVFAFAGILIAGKSSNPLMSFLGYNLVVVPFGLVIALLVKANGGTDSEIVKYAFLYTMLIAMGITGASLAFPRLFAKLGGALLGVLIGLVLCELVLLILGVDQEVTDWIAAGLFSLYIGFDVYRSQQFPKTLDNAVDCALDIYLDLANLFIRILSIMAKRKD